MSWLQAHDVAIPFYEVRAGKQVFVIQLKGRPVRQEVKAPNGSGLIQSMSARRISPEDDKQINSMTVNTSGVQITATRSYSQFRKLWKDLTLATKTPSSASLSRFNSAGPVHVDRSSHRLLATSLHSLSASGSEFSSSCRCRSWNCTFRSFHHFLKSYPFPSKFQIKRNTPSVLESRRQKLELFITTLRGLFDTFPRSYLQSIDALDNCQVLMSLSAFFGFNEKRRVNSGPRLPLQLSVDGRSTGIARCRRPDSVVSMRTTFFSARSHDGDDSTNDICSFIGKDCNSQSQLSSTGQRHRKRESNSNHLKNMDCNSHRRGDPEFPVSLIKSHEKHDDDDSMTSADRTVTRNSTSSHRAKRTANPADYWSRYSCGVDIRRHTVFLARNPVITTRRGAAAFDTKAPQTLLLGLPKVTLRNEEASMCSFLEKFREHLLMDPRALGSPSVPMGNWNEDRQWELALFVASQIGHAHAVESILYRGTNANAVMESGHTSLQVACRGGHRSIVAMLLTHGADTNITDRNEVSPLLSAVQLGDLEIMEMLVEYDANVNLRNTDNVSTVHVAVACQTLPVLQLLLEHDAFVNTRNDFNGKTPLHLAAQFGNLPMCKLLMNHGASIHHKTARGLDVVDLANSHGHENIARYCISFANHQSNSHRGTASTKQTAKVGDCTSEFSHEVKFVSEDGHAYAVL
uniref:Ankyrin repeat protein n=1 Tax=Peronospora matthiolae TaxID=2874970 RepID=A0AAV1UW55_9STRA